MYSDQALVQGYIPQTPVCFCILGRRSILIRDTSASSQLTPAKTRSRRGRFRSPTMSPKRANIWSQTARTNLVFKNEARPAARFLYYHFVVTLLRNKLYRTERYAHHLNTLSTGRPFATMGVYLRKSMLLTLARKAGDLIGGRRK